MNPQNPSPTIRSMGADEQQGAVERRRARPGSGLVVGEERTRLRATLGTRLAAERAALRWSAVTLAEASGVTSRAIEYLESGHRRPSDVMLWRLSRGLRPGANDMVIAELAAALEAEAGSSLVRYSERRRRRRERLLAGARARSADPGPDPAAALVVARVTAALRPEGAR